MHGPESDIKAQNLYERFCLIAKKTLYRHHRLLLTSVLKVDLRETMDVIWSVVDNFTEVTETADSSGSLNTTVALPTPLMNRNRWSLSLDARLIAGLLVSLVGSCANTLVLSVLVLARREFGSNVNTFIINQSAMDLFACLSVVTVYAVMLTRGFEYVGNRVVDGIICVVLQGGVFAAVGLTAGKIGLVVITLERYFKVVHAIAHRKYYRDWMTKAGVALPWIGATCLILFPAIGTSRIVNGRCLRLGVWPNAAMAKVRLNRRSFSSLSKKQN